MPLNQRQIEKIEHVIKDSIRRKFESYNPESQHMPFHFRLLGRDRIALFSFIHSLNTTFGTSIFEPVAEIIAEEKYKYIQKQYIVGEYISDMAQAEIQHIINELSYGSIDKKPDKYDEIERIRRVCNKGDKQKIRTVKADLYIESLNGTYHLFDLKTAKPNISSFRDHKRTLLEWIAIFLLKNPNAKIESYIAIPYNPYEPEPYQRWTLRGMLDIENELKVADEFWDFLGGEGAYEELLKCFEKAGIELREEIDNYFLKFKSMI